jgi:CHAT domain-containing protein
LEKLNRYFSVLSEKSRDTLLQSAVYMFDDYSNFAHMYPNLPGAISMTYDNALMLKGLLLQSSRLVVSTLENSDDETLRTKYRQMQDLRQLIVRQRSLLPEFVQYTKTELDSLDQLADRLEAELTRSSEAFSKNRLNISWQTVQSKLKPREVGLEFIHFPYYENGKPTDSILYAALLLRSGWKHPRMVYLCEEKELANLFQDMGRDSFTVAETYQTGPANYRDGKRNSRMYNLLWKPLEKHLKSVKKIYYSPSGMMHRVAFPAIAEKPGTLLSDKYDLEYVASTRELVFGKKTLPGDAAHINTAAVFGGLLYESDSILFAQAEERMPCTNSPRDGERSTPGFLPGSLFEMRMIYATLTGKGISCDTFSGYEGTEAMFKTLTSDTLQRSPHVLHLSTHGYYYPYPKSQRDAARYDAPFKWSDNPLFRSYLLMAGGLNAHFGTLAFGTYDDGILSAYEIAPLNLSNTTLIVLSACQTGLGDVRGSEGVYGLQRAFKMAGVEHLLVTLWQVDDRATAAFMKTFYTRWLSGMDIRAAFEKAKADIRRTPGWEDPYYWAGFVLM